MAYKIYRNHSVKDYKRNISDYTNCKANPMDYLVWTSGKGHYDVATSCQKGKKTYLNTCLGDSYDGKKLSRAYIIDNNSTASHRKSTYGCGRTN